MTKNKTENLENFTMDARSKIYMEKANNKTIDLKKCNT